MARIIVLDDEMLLRRSIRRALEKVGHQVYEADRLEPALKIVRDQEIELAITDLHLGSEDGLDFVRSLRGRGYDGGIIIMTAYGTVESAVVGIRHGADEYLQKPLSLEELQLLVERTLDHRRVRGRLSVYEQIEQYARLENELIGESRVWIETRESAERMASRVPTSEGGAVTLLLTGETGTGKGSLARHIHHCVRAKSGPFVQIRCYALPPGIIDGELFGRDGGGYMGSEPLRYGLFETSRGGTFYLDGIAELSMPLQSKLLAVIDRGRDEHLRSAIHVPRQRRAHQNVADRIRRHGSGAEGAVREFPGRSVLSPERHVVATSPVARTRGRLHPPSSPLKNR